MTVAIESSMREMLLRILDAHYAEPDEPSHRAGWIDLTLDHVGDSADVELARSGVWSGTLAEWLEVGPGLVRRVPVGRVELVDREPKRLEILYVWYIYKKAWLLVEAPLEHPEFMRDLPNEWFSEIDNRHTQLPYDTLELALADASRRAIAWARLMGEPTP